MLHNVVELRPGWYIRLPFFFTRGDIYRSRFDPISVALIVAGSYAAGSHMARKAGKPKPPAPVAMPQPVEEKKADVAKDVLLKRFAKLRRATQLSQLSEPNVKRTMLGAGAL